MNSKRTLAFLAIILAVLIVWRPWQHRRKEFVSPFRTYGDERPVFDEHGVEYYNPSTGTRSHYTLDAEFDADGRVERIEFPNGGWLDETHIVSQEDKGDEVVVTTDEGYEYAVEK